MNYLLVTVTMTCHHQGYTAPCTVSPYVWREDTAGTQVPPEDPAHSGVIRSLQHACTLPEAHSVGPSTDLHGLHTHTKCFLPTFGILLYCVEFHSVGWGMRTAGETIQHTALGQPGLFQPKPLLTLPAPPPPDPVSSGTEEP